MSRPAPTLAGVIGSPISHSLSPAVHRYWLEKYRLSGFYIPLDLAPDRLEAGLEALRLLGFKGVNVTLPHKEQALALAVEATEAARQIGAANTLTFDPSRGLVADCTDAHGFIENLRQFAPDWRADTGPAMVLGAGGAARAIIQALLSQGAPQIRLINRTRERAERLAAHFGPKVIVANWSERDTASEGASLMVNATSLGLAGGEPLEIRLDALPGTALVTDIVYNPLQTGLLKAAKARGLATVEGLGMLLHQAAPGFQRWFGQKPDIDDDLRRAVLKT